MGKFLYTTIFSIFKPSFRVLPARPTIQNFLTEGINPLCKNFAYLFLNFRDYLACNLSLCVLQITGRGSQSPLKLFKDCSLSKVCIVTLDSIFGNN